MKKLWLSALTAVTLLAGTSFGTAAWAGDRHGHHRDHHRYEHRDHGHRNHGYRGKGWGHHHHHGHHAYREVRNVYYVPAPRYYAPERVYYSGYGRGYDSGVRGSITVDF